MHPVAQLSPRIVNSVESSEQAPYARQITWCPYAKTRIAVVGIRLDLVFRGLASSSLYSLDRAASNHGVAVGVLIRIATIIIR